jgi:hypothetical protein
MATLQENGLVYDCEGVSAREPKSMKREYPFKKFHQLKKSTCNN